MKKNLFRPLLSGALATVLLLTACNKDDNGGGDQTNPDDNTRWITISGAKDDPSNDDQYDGNEGTMVYAVSLDDARNPEVSINVFDQGVRVRSQRTARLQASVDGKFLYNIQYVGDDGGIFNKYRVLGGDNFLQDPIEVDTEPYVSASPRWLKVSEKVGVAVRATANPVEYSGESPNYVFKRQTTKVDLLTLDLEDPKIIKTKSFADVALTEEEVAAGYYIWRMDMAVLNKAQDKLYVGVGVRKLNVANFTLGDDGLPVFATDNTAENSFAKTMVFDYPSLENPKVITSEQTRGNTNGYRSTMQYVGDDGNVYQATVGEGYGNGGSKILRINAATNDYDSDYVFSLDQALGVQDSYIETWKYAGNGVGFVVYSLVDSEGKRNGGHIARIDLNTGTATKYDISNEAALSFRQVQNLGIEGDEVFIAIAAPGQEGNIYVFNRETGEMKKGAKLLNEAGGQYIGLY